MDCPDAIMGPEESESGSRDGGSKEVEHLANAVKETSSGSRSGMWIVEAVNALAPSAKQAAAPRGVCINNR